MVLEVLENLRIFLDLFGDRGIAQHISTGSIDKFTHATQGVNFEGATRAIKDRSVAVLCHDQKGVWKTAVQWVW